MEIGRQLGIGAELAMLDRILQRELRGRQQHGELGPGQATILLHAAQQVVVRRQSFDQAVKPGQVVAPVRQALKLPEAALAQVEAGPVQLAQAGNPASRAD